jgi:DHA1 family tetracycline resistance protein-like MFS transporter
MVPVMQKRQASLGFIFITLFLDIMGLGLVIPVLPKLIESFLNDDIARASTIYGVLVALYALMQFLFAPVLGNLSDRYGRRPVILLSLLGAGLDYLLLAFAPTLGWLFVGRVIAGVTAANLTTVTAYIADISPPEKRAQNFGLIGAAFGLGFILGPVLGGLLGNIDLRLPFFVVAGITLLNTLYGYFVLPESLKPENRRAFSWARANPVGSLVALQHYPTVINMAVITVLVGLASNFLHSIWVLYSQYRFAWGPSEVGWSLAVVGLVAAIVQGGLIGPVVRKLGEPLALTIGLGISAISYLLYGLATQGWMFYVIPIFSAIGFIAGPSAQALISRGVKDDEQGAVQGAIASLTSLTGVVGPLVATNVFRLFISEQTPVRLPGAPFYLGSLLFLIALAVAVRAFAQTPVVGAATSGD